MKHLLYAFMVVSLFACQKENRSEEKEPPVVEPAPVPAACKVNTIREYPAVDGKNIVRTFTYDDKNRVIRMDVQQGSSVPVAKNFSYNADNRIDKITYASGAYETFVYTNGAFTNWEAFGSDGKPTVKSTFSYEGGKLVREDRHAYSAEGGNYVLQDYMIFEWDANGNIISIKTFAADNVLKATDTYLYHTDKLNRQPTSTPQMHLMFMNWSNDITAFINSKNLLREATAKKRKLVYETNDVGLVTTIKSDKNENFFLFTYGCGQ